MSIGSLFITNRTQAVRLPADTRFPEGVKKILVRVNAQDRILSPLNRSWDTLFLAGQTVSDDIMRERASQQQAERESF